MTHPARFDDLRDASVFITGGGSGIGAALTRGFLDQGARVAFIGRSDYTALVDEMEQATGLRPLFIRGDVTDTAALQAAIDRAEAAHGPLDVLVNNAANDQRFDAMEVTEDDWDSQQAINLRHLFFSMQRAARTMRGRGGRIVNFTSITYMEGHPNLAPYAAAKAGITGLTRTLAREWGADGVRVNAVAPGMVLTKKQLDKWIGEDDISDQLDKQALKVRMGPEEMVAPTLFLASEASRMITGQVLVVDGGVVTTG